MRIVSLSLAILGVIISGCNRGPTPPHAPIKPVKDSYFGVEISDPYRYMENMDDTLFLNWMKSYADYTRGVLDAIPGRKALLDQLFEFDSRSSDRVFGLYITRNNRYFYLKMTPQDEYGKLFWRDGYTGKETLLYDPASYSNDNGSVYTIMAIYPDSKGSRVIVMVAPDGSENFELIVIEVEEGVVLDDRLKMVGGSIAWLKNDDAFLYGKLNSDNIHDPARRLDTKVYLHRLGSLQDEDQMIFSSGLFPEVNMRPEEIPRIIYDLYGDDYYLILLTVERYIRVYHAASAHFSQSKPFRWEVLLTPEDQVQDFYPKGDSVYLYTAKDAPGFKILRIAKTNPVLDQADIIVPESDLGMISGYYLTSSGLFYKIKVNGVEERLFKMSPATGEHEEILLPTAAGTIVVQTRGHKHDDLWVTLTGWTNDAVRYRYLDEENRFVEEPLSSRAAFPEYKDVVVEEVMVSSHDGMQVPLSIMYKEGTVLDGTAPLLITGYGAYGIALKPAFSFARLMWTLQGGVIAVTHVRGGGELGDKWRLGGHKTTKPNTWKDFIACTEYLHENGYSSPERTAMFGGSAGGVLIGRAMTERPDLFAASVPMVGLMNPLRAEESPNGPVNAPEFGTVKDSVECMALIEMDAYLKIEDGVKYPATLTVAGFNDPRVIVWQPAKFAARLQAANGSRNPVLFDVDYTSGHGTGDTKSKSFNDYADLMAFALWQTGHPDFQ